MQSAKSTQVLKPQMQTATPCAPARIVVGRVPVARGMMEAADVSSETLPPPSYATAFQQRQQTPDPGPSLPSYADSFQQRQQTLDSCPSPVPSLPSYASPSPAPSLPSYASPSPAPALPSYASSMQAREAVINRA